MQELAVAAMNRRTGRLVTWLFVVAVLLLLVCSCAVHVRFSSRPTAEDGDTRRVRAAAGFATASRYRRMPSSKGNNPGHNRRLLGTRTTTGLPPPPLPNKPKATVIAPPPPPLQ